MRWRHCSPRRAAVLCVLQRLAEYGPALTISTDGLPSPIIEARLLEVAAHQLLLARGEALVDGVLEEVLEDIEVREVQIVDAAPLHPVMWQRWHEEHLVEVLLVGVELIADVHVLFIPPLLYQVLYQSFSSRGRRAPRRP